MARHSKPRWWSRRRAVTPARRLLEVVDAGTLTMHQLTPDALAADAPGGRYVALCGAHILPAALVEPGSDRCRSCRAVA